MAALVTWSAVLLLITCLAGGVASLIEAKRWLVIGAGLFAGALAFRMAFLDPRHIMYVDEPWYMESARTFLHRGALELCQQTTAGLTCHPYGKAPGWPLLLASAFALGGPSDHVAFGLAIALGALCVPLAAAVTLEAGGRWTQALLAAVVVAAHPLHARWSATGETNAPSTAVLLAGLIGALQYVKQPSWRSALLAAGGLGFAGAMRPELSLAAVPVLAWTAWRSRRPQTAVIWIGAMLGALSVPFTWGMYITNSGGPFLRIVSIAANVRQVIHDPLGGSITLGIGVVAAAGLVVTLRRDRRTAVVLGGAGVLIALAVLAYDPRIFYTRNLLGATIALVPLAALALPRGLIGGVLALGAAAGVLFTARAALPEATRVPEPQALENALPAKVAQVALPENALVLAAWPTVIRATTDVPAITVGDVLKDGSDDLAQLAAQRPVYLLCDMFCEPGAQSGTDIDACRRVLEGFTLEEVTSTRLNDRRYGLYRIKGRAQGRATLPGCPRVWP